MQPSTLRWTAASRARLHHFRTTHPKDPKDAHALLAPTDAWSALRARAATGRASATPALHDALARLRREFAAEQPPPFDQDFALFQLAYVVGHCPTDRDLLAHRDWAPERELMGCWAAGSASDVLRALLGSAPFWLETGSEWCDEVTTSVMTLRETPPSHFAVAPPSFRLSEVFAVVERGLWWAFRMRLDALDERAFAAVNDDAHRARRALATTAYKERSQIALAFARDPSHADEERALAAEDAGYAGADLCRVALASRTIGACAPLLQRTMEFNVGDLSDVAYDLVETLGADAAGLLQSAVASLQGRKMNAALRQAIQRPLAGALGLLH